MGSEFIHGITWFLFLVAICAIKAKAVTVNVVKFGAKGDGKTDDTKAFTQAWTQACSERQNNKYVIPKGKYIVGPVDFAGPCKAKTITFKIDGTVQSSKKQSVTGGAHRNAWISFTQVNNLFISGDGIFDGQGFEGNCTKAKQCEQPALNLIFAMVKDSHIKGITSNNSVGGHIGIYRSINVTVDDVAIGIKGGEGILIDKSTNINITNTDIKILHDNCVTILDGNTGINIEKMTCSDGNGLGVSVLGNTGKEEPVKGVTVRNCTFSRTEGAIRIQSSVASNANIAISNLVFEDIIFDYLQNMAIILDQEHCPSRQCRRPNPSKVKVSNVSFKNIKGTSVDPRIVILECGTAPGACKDIRFSDMRVLVVGHDFLETQFRCKNVKPAVSGKVDPAACNTGAVA